MYRVLITVQSGPLKGQRLFLRTRKCKDGMKRIARFRTIEKAYAAADKYWRTRGFDARGVVLDRENNEVGSIGL